MCSGKVLNGFFKRIGPVTAAGWGQDRRVEALGFHLLFGDGTVGATIPGSAGDDFFVSLADVWNFGHAET